LTAQKLTFSVHALQAMYLRNISVEEVRNTLATGKSIETYPDDRPYPSLLILSWSGSRPIHVVSAQNQTDSETVIITVYEPDLARWEPGFERRKKQ
jgi:hypothetical protein